MTALLLTVAAGVWLTAAPQLAGYGGSAASVHHVFGPLIASVGCVACSEVVRGLRWANVALAVVLGAASLIPPFAAPIATFVALSTAGVVAALSALAPTPRGRFGGGWSALGNGK
jgi:hypothetical protein